jgi:hypothetical protein
MLREAIDVGRVGSLGTVATQVAVADVVGVKEDDVGPL